MEKSAAKLPQTNGFSGRAIRKIGPKPLNLQKLFWCRLRDSKSARTACEYRPSRTLTLQSAPIRAPGAQLCVCECDALHNFNIQPIF